MLLLNTICSDLDQNPLSSSSHSRHVTFVPKKAVRLRNLPFSWKKEQIVEFFAGLVVTHHRSVPNPSGCASSEALVQLATESEAKIALTFASRQSGRFIQSLS